MGIFNSSHAKVSKFNYDAKNISNYFSGLVSFDDFDYEEVVKINEKQYNIKLKKSK